MRLHPNREIVVADDLTEAIQIATQRTDTGKAIAFDGSYGSINMTREMAEYLIDHAPAVARQVDEELLPKWLRQRNLPAVAQRAAV